VSAAAGEASRNRYDIALDCVHCGLCLPVCPTYQHLGDEADSPRGRIYLMRAHEEGRQSTTLDFLAHLDRCLVCRACETACPSGVRFGSMMEDFRALVRPEASRQRAAEAPGAAARLRAALGGIVLAHVLPYPGRLGIFVGALRLYQTSPVPALLRRSGILAALGLEAQEALAPRVPPRSARRPAPRTLAPRGRRRARVLLLRGCVTPELLPELRAATLAVLQHQGCEVVVPPAQTCCGALHFHLGDRETGMRLLARNVAAFDLRDVDAVVVDAAGCGSTLKEYGEHAAGRPELAEKAAALAAHSRDVCEFLVGLGLLPPEGEARLRVAYDDPCHLLHAQRIADAPRELLRAVPGLELVPLRDADRCCGSAGVYNLLQPALAARILDDKVRHVAASGAEVVATGNPGCILQLRAGLARAAALDADLARIRVAHPLELFAAACTPSRTSEAAFSR
jgi:glycolate oxidase iron-sulfur subunit